MRGRAVWALVSGASVLLVSGLASAQCTKDTDCKGDRVCEAGKCTSPVPLPPAPPAPPGSAGPAAGAATDPAPGEPATGADGAATAADPKPAAPEEPPSAAVDLQVQPEPDRAPVGAVTPLGQDEPQTRRRSRNAMVAGIVMVSVGPIALLGALAAKNGQERCDDELERDYPDHRLPTSERYRVEDCESYSAPLYIFGIGGALLTVGGIPLIIYGSKKVPQKSAATSLRIMPWAGADSSGLKLRLEM